QPSVQAALAALEYPRLRERQPWRRRPRRRSARGALYELSSPEIPFNMPGANQRPRSNAFCLPDKLGTFTPSSVRQAALVRISVDWNHLYGQRRAPRAVPTGSDVVGTLRFAHYNCASIRPRSALVARISQSRDDRSIEKKP